MSSGNQITGRQIAAARVLLGIGQSELAQRAFISVPTLRRMEANDGAASGSINNVRSVISALEDANIEFILNEGIRLRKAD